jgi:hypothetical protein
VILQITKTTTRVDLSTRESARRHFDDHHWIALPRLIDGDLLTHVQDVNAPARFVEVRHDAVTPPSVDMTMEPDTVSALLELLCNDAAIPRSIETLTGCASLVRFSGCLYRLMPEAGHQHNRYKDVAHDRRVAMRINLGPATYEGGVLEIRELTTGRVIERVFDTGPGDAILFRIDALRRGRL